MSTAGLAHYYITPEEYLAAEHVSERKHEYVAGRIYAMADTTVDHGRIVGNICASLLTQLNGRTCEAFSSNIKVHIRRAETMEFYYYPDVIVDCSNPPGDQVFVEEPRVIFGALSPATERIDRGEKLANYQALLSLDVYVLVDQFHIAVTVYRRTAQGWVSEFYAEKSDVLQLPTIECALPMTTIYERTHLVR